MKKTFLVLLNPKSGQGAGLDALQALQREALKHDVTLDTQVTVHAGHAEEIVQAADLNTLGAIIAIGGDGTLHEVINGLPHEASSPLPPLGILPTGTGNSLATDLGTTDPAPYINSFFKNQIRNIDLFRVNFGEKIRYGFNMLGCGFPARINQAAENSRVFKGLRYEMGVCKSLLHYQPSEVSVSFPEMDSPIQTDFLIATNTRNIGKGISIAPHAKLDDGKLDVLTLSQTGRKVLLPLWIKVMKGTHLGSAMVTHQNEASFSVSAPEPQLLNLDGELYSFSNLTCRVIPRQLPLFYPSPEEPNS